MSLLVVNNLEKRFGPDVIFTGVSFKLEWRQKLGLVGRNGIGKTTLLRILTGQQEAEKGTINYWRGIRTGYLKQEDAVDPSRTVLQEAEAAFAHVQEMERRMREVEQEMGSVTDEAELLRIMDEYGVLHDRFDAMGGYDNLRDIPGVLKRLGFGPNDLNKPCGKLSGGEKTRLAIARLLLSGPDILFLDEPTNHLDIEATEWLEGFLKDFGGAVVLVSHDRYFLDRVITTIAEIENQKLTLYTGNFSAYWMQKEANRKRQEEMYEREQRKIAELTAFFEKWKNTPSKKNQAVMRLRWAERIKQHGLTQKLDAKATEKAAPLAKNVKLGIKPTQLSGNEVVILDSVGKRYGDRVLFENVTQLLRRGERVGIVGPNGAGKSTLIKILLGRETPTTGMARLGASVTVGYFAQDTSDLDLDATVLENMMDVKEMEPVEARTHLGRFLFTGDDVFRPARLLSGGEKNKLVLAQLTSLRPNLLILDEPTNHLDLDSRAALGEMLKEYDGTLLLVSHDRYLLDQVTTHTLEVAGGRVTFFDGPYGKFRAEKAARALREGAGSRDGQGSGKDAPESRGGNGIDPKLESLLAQHPTSAISVPTGLNFHQMSKERQRAKNQVAAAERKVAELEERLRKIEATLSAPTSADNVVALSQEHGGVQNALAEAMAVWEQAAAYSEALG
ncbi:MAG TPA: ABC-F family ATP-binding cassette domain-containing protein [Chthonomonadaceae bacterium]|nr:ABC-F family ATP-binding cassette domain-containing protein [Chthonomonadaceae bacterium]